MNENSKKFEKTQKPKKRSLFKRLLFGLFLPITGLYYLPKQIINSLWLLAKHLFLRFAQELIAERTAFKKQVKEQREKRPISFEELRSLWGIETELAINQMHRMLTIHMVIWIICMTIGCYVMVVGQRPMQKFCGSVFVITCVFGVLSTIWRKHILKNRQFEYFTNWLKFWV